MITPLMLIIYLVHEKNVEIFFQFFSIPVSIISLKLIFSIEGEL